MKIGYNKLIVSLPVVLAALLAILAILDTRKGLPIKDDVYFYIAGLLILSVPMYFIPYIIITNTQIVVNNQFGMPRRRRAISGFGDIRFEKGVLQVRQEGVFQKFHISKILADPKGLKALKLKTESN